MSEILKVRFTEILPCEVINPTTRGIVERWQGDSKIESTPQAKEANITIQTVPVIAWDKLVNNPSIIRLSFCFLRQALFLQEFVNFIFGKESLMAKDFFTLFI